MSKKYTLILGLIGVVVSGPTYAQQREADSASNAMDRFKINGSMRIRYEVLEGQARAGLNDTDEQLSIRTAILAQYEDERFKIVGELVDSRGYLSEPGGAASANEVNTLEPTQAYAVLKLGSALGSNSTFNVQAGRFTMALGSKRLVAADEYRNAMTSFTGIRADYSGPTKIVATAFYALPQIRLPDDQPSILKNKPKLDYESLNLRFFGGLVTIPTGIKNANAELGYFRLYERDSLTRPTRDRRLHTFNVRFFREPAIGKIDFDLEGALQTGATSLSSAASAANLSVGASMFHAEIGYSFAGPAKIRIATAFDHVSGDKSGGKFGRFDTLFGSRRSEYGPSGIYSEIGRANISSPSLRFVAAPNSRIDFFAMYRAMWLASKTDAFSTTGVRDPAGLSGKFGGHQLDGRVRYWIIPKRLRAEINAAWIAKGQFLTIAPNAPAAGDTHYFSTAITASF